MPGASEQVNAVFTYAYAQAALKSSEANEAYAKAMAIVGKAPPIVKATPAMPVVIPNALVPSQPGVNSGVVAAGSGVNNVILDRYGPVAAEVEQMLKDEFSTFLQTYFPLDPTSLEAATEWINTALTVGGSGINANVETQLWNRDRARILEDLSRAQDEAITGWAARRFPVPPGAATYQVLQLQRDAAVKIADVSREQAVKSFQTEIENVRLAVGRALELRTSAVGAAGEYIKILAVGPQTDASYSASLASASAALENVAASYYGSFTSAQASLESSANSARASMFGSTSSAAASMFGSQIEGSGINSRIAIANAESQTRVNELTAKLTVELLTAQVQAAIAAAHAAGTQAAAALNALHAQASISGNDSTVINV